MVWEIPIGDLKDSLRVLEVGAKTTLGARKRYQFVGRNRVQRAEVFIEDRTLLFPMRLLELFIIGNRISI